MQIITYRSEIDLPELSTPVHVAKLAIYRDYFIFLDRKYR